MLKAYIYLGKGSPFLYRHLGRLCDPLSLKREAPLASYPFLCPWKRQRRLLSWPSSVGNPSLGLASSAMFSSNLLFFIFTKHLGRVYALREGVEHRRERVGSRAQSPPSSPPARVAVQGLSATFGALSQAPGEGGQWKWGLGTAKQTAPLVISSACGGRIVSFFKGACDFLLFCRWEGVRSFVRYEVGGRCCTARVTGGREAVGGVRGVCPARLLNTSPTREAVFAVRPHVPSARALGQARDRL